jgi:hypothetical protein
MDEFRATLATGLERSEASIRLADLELTDRALATLLAHREALRSGAATAAFMIEMRTPSYEALSHGLRAARESLGIKPLLLHRGLSELCGAIHVQATEILAHVQTLVELDQEMILAGNEAANVGVVVEYVTDPISVGAPTFFLLAWCGYERH